MTPCLLEDPLAQAERAGDVELVAGHGRIEVGDDDAIVGADRALDTGLVEERPDGT